MSAILEWFEKVRAVPIVEVVAALGIALNHNGKDKIRSACFLPSHPGLNKTGTAFSIHTALNVWYCHGCKIGGGNIELVQQLRGYAIIEAANFIAQCAHLETWDELKSATPEEKASRKQQMDEETIVHAILAIAAHHFHDALVPELRQTLLIPQGSFEPKDTWHNLYETWGITDGAIDDNLIGFDDGTLLLVLKSKGYSDGDIFKSGLFYRQDDGSIGDSVVKNRSSVPLQIAATQANAQVAARTTTAKPKQCATPRSRPGHCAARHCPTRLAGDRPGALQTTIASWAIAESGRSPAGDHRAIFRHRHRPVLSQGRVLSTSALAISYGKPRNLHVLRLLPGLAKWGFPTTTENAKHLVAFLSEYEAANREHIQVRQVVSSCGNKIINGQTAFVLGRRCIYRDKEEPIEFLAPDAGDIQIVSAFEAFGNFDNWVAMLHKCIPYDGVLLAIYAAFAGPFLNLLKNKGFTYHVWGRSSIGKTIALTICASVW